MKKHYLLITLLGLFSTMLQADNMASQHPPGLSYTKKSWDNHLVHILKIDPKLYQLELIKANHQVQGRETVSKLCQDNNAIAAINAGFFEISPGKDGYPAGTLMIKGEIFTLAKGRRALLAFNDKQVDIGFAEGQCKVVLNGQKINPIVINKYSTEKNVVLYNSAWGENSPASDRQELLIDHQKKILNVMHHGNNSIPEKGWILSLPKSFKVPEIKQGQSIAIEHYFMDTKTRQVKWQDKQNMVMGIPLLVVDGRINPNLKQSSKKFVEHPHARTAIGVSKDGSIIMIVAEHTYQQSLNHNANSTVGLNLYELARLLINEGCVKALNLDGGGSSTFFLDGKLRNTTIGDEDEALGEFVERPVSDALLVLRR